MSAHGQFNGMHPQAPQNLVKHYFAGSWKTAAWWTQSKAFSARVEKEEILRF
jgi:hypothetical protein